MHLVHKDNDGKLAVVGLLFELGKANPLLDTIWKNIPGKKNEERAVEGVMINPADFLPGPRTYYNYSGSLTTPPCSEGVNWNVFNTPLQLSQEQLAAFQSFYKGNNRPIQSIGDRAVENF